MEDKSILVPGIDSCPRCGSKPLIYEAMSTDRHSQSIAVCRNCKTQAYDLIKLKKEAIEIDSMEETPFGDFEVKCNKCGSTNVNLDNSMGFSPESGGWGSLDLECQDCGNRTELMAP
jgi:ribosomal protein S27E